MQANYKTIAAIAAGGLLLSRLMRGGDRGYSNTSFSIDDRAERDLHLRMPVGSAVAMLGAATVGGLLLSNQLRKGRGDGASSTVEEAIELNVPVSTAYNQWTQFEEFPKFMASVEQVTQVDDTHLHWRALVAGKTKEWDAEITEQIPDQKIAWRSTTGVPNAGVVTFHKIGDNRTRVMLQMDYQPETVVEKVGDAFGGVKVTTPPLATPLVLRQAMRWSGICSVISASHSLVLPATLARQCRWVSSSWLTCSTVSMKRGNSSNWVNWLYAVLTGTSTRMVCSTICPLPLPVRFFIWLANR